jgi:surfactin family lipopeptide synthetase A
MSFVELISSLRKLKVKLWVDGDNLRLNAPPNTITPELQQELTRHKAELIAFLQQATLPLSGPQSPLQVKPRPEQLPLSFAQERLWFLHQLEPGSPMYNIPLAFRLRGPVDIAAVQHSLSLIIERHETLRTVFDYHDGHACQVILPSEPFQLQQVDLSDDWQAWLQAEANRPFDLKRGPILRAALLKLGQNDSVLFLNIHHIATDGWSISVLLREITEAYSALVKGRLVSLSPLPVQYADFAIWQRDWLQGETLNTQLDYWRAQLQGVPFTIELPTDHPRPAAQTYRGAMCEFPISTSLLERFKAFSNQQGATLFMTLLAAFQVLLYRYSNQTQFTVGTPIANRTRAEVEGLIGFFVNTLVLYADLAGEPSFLELLQRVREASLGAHIHQDLPFEKLVDELKVERNLNRNSLFQVMFVLQNTPDSALILSEVETNELSIATDSSKFDLTFSVKETSGGALIAIEYSTALFDNGSIERMAGHYQHLLEGILEDPEQKVACLPILTDVEHHRLLVEWNNTRVEYPQDKCVHELFEAQAKHMPDAVALVFEDQQLNYRELNTRANQLAHYLRASGVGAESCVGIFVERSLEMMIALLGILKAGGAYVPLDPTLPIGRVSAIIEEAHPVLVLTQLQLRGHLPPGIPTFLIDTEWKNVENYSATNPACAVQPTNLAYVMFTSGSTGHPKGVAIEHRQLRNYLNGIVQRLALSVGVHYALVSTFAADLGNTVIFPALCTGGTLHIISYARALSPDLLADYFRHHPIDCLKIVPSHLRALLSVATPANILPRQCLVLGGEVLDWELVNRIRRLAPDCRIINHYGPTETTVGVLTYPVPDQNVPSTNSVPLGRPLGNAKMYILDPYGQLTPTGVPGELHIGGDGVGRGYLNRPELTAERFIVNQYETAPEGRIYKTGDLVRYLPDGNIEFVGRLDYQVKIRGYRIELGEIEAVLSQHPEVQACVVVAREDVLGNKRLVAYVVSRKKGDLLTPMHLREYAETQLPNYMVPSVFMVLEAIPLTPNGKVDRRALPVPKQTLLPEPDNFVSPQTPTEIVIAQVWTVLQLEQQPSIHDNFFDLGGHSLLATQVVSRLQRALQVKLPLRAMFEKPTIAELAPYTESLYEPKPAAINPLDEERENVEL